MASAPGFSLTERSSASNRQGRFELEATNSTVTVREMYRMLPQIRAEGLSVLLVEQDVGQALKVADRVVCLQEGRVSLEGSPADLTREQISRAYFGV